MKKAAILIADGFEEIEALTPFDLLNRAGVDVDLVSVSGAPTARGANGLVIEDLVSMEGYSFADADLLILPGGSGCYEILRADRTVCDEAAAFAHDDKKVLGAICASGALIGQLGLLKGRSYTCYPTMDGDFGGTRQPGPAVVDGNIITGIGPGGSIPFALDLVTAMEGPEKTAELKKAICWETD